MVHLTGMFLHPLNKFQPVGRKKMQDLEATFHTCRSELPETLSNSDNALHCVSVSDDHLIVSKSGSTIFKLPLALATVDSGLDASSGLPALWLQPPDAELPTCMLVSSKGEAALASALEAICARGAIHKDLRCVYKLQSEVLGKGNFGSVRVVSSKGSSSQYAAKLLETEDFQMTSVRGSTQVIPQEAVMLLAAQSHPNILRFAGIFGTQATADETVAKDQDRSLPWALVTECCLGGNVFTLVKSQGACCEKNARELTMGVVAALKHLHHRGLVHRDVKAENILLRADGVPVLADFGLCVSLASDPDSNSYSQACTTPELLAGVSSAKEIQWYCGSPGYIAPEILLKTGNYGPKIDVFATGVIYYFLLSGDFPFRGGVIASTLRKSVKCKVRFSANPNFQHVSTDCLCLVKLFLSRMPEDRPSSTEALDMFCPKDGLKNDQDCASEEWAKDKVLSMEEMIATLYKSSCSPGLAGDGDVPRAAKALAVRRPSTCRTSRRPHSEYHRRLFSSRSNRSSNSQ